MRIQPSVWRDRLDFVDKQDVSRIARQTSQEENSLPSLGNKGQRIDDTVSPSISSFLERGHNSVHRAALIEAEHERDVLQQHPIWPATIDQSKDVIHQSRFLTPDAGGSSSLTEILTGESGCHQLDCWQRLQLGNIARVRHGGKTRCEDCRGRDSIL